MNYEEKEGSISFRYLRIPSSWEILLVLLLFYSFFFQYGVTTINNAMMGLNALCIIFGLWSLVNGGYKRKHSFYTWIIAFVFVSVLFGIIFGVSSRASAITGLRMIEYCLTGFSVLLFSIKHRDRYLKVVFFTWLFILMLAITVLFKGTSEFYSGAVGIATLNTNEMSSFFLLMIFCAFCLYGSTSNKMQKVIIGLSIVIVFFVQIQSASRRGFIVMLFMIVMNIAIAVIPYNNPTNSFRKLIIYSLMIFLGIPAFIELRDYVFNNTILGERLAGNMIGGDVLRMRYHIFAMEQFIKHPFFGVGVGGINFLQGVYSHSLYYETISCTGIIGTLLLIIGAFSLIKYLWKKLIREAIKRDDYHNFTTYYDKIATIYFCGILASGVAVVMIYNFYFYYSLGMIAAGIQWTENVRFDKSGVVDRI